MQWLIFTLFIVIFHVPFPHLYYCFSICSYSHIYKYWHNVTSSYFDTLVSNIINITTLLITIFYSDLAIYCLRSLSLQTRLLSHVYVLHLSCTLDFQLNMLIILIHAVEWLFPFTYSIELWPRSILEWIHLNDMTFGIGIIQGGSFGWWVWCIVYRYTAFHITRLGLSICLEQMAAFSSKA